MGKFKQMQIDIDDDYNASFDEQTEEVEQTLDDVSYDDVLEEFFKEQMAKTINRCKHKVKMVISKKVIVTYCEKCGKIFDQAKR